MPKPVNLPRMEQHPLTLRFRSDDLEQAFLANYTRQSLRQVRYGILLGLLLYGVVFAFSDLLTPTDAVPAIWGVRAVVCLIGFGVWAATYRPGFRRVMQPVMSALLLLAGAGLLIMLVLDPSGTAYVDGPVLIILPAYVLVRLRFVWATLAGWGITVGFLVVGAVFEGMSTAALTGSLLFFSAANLIGMFAGYELERYARRDFLQVRALNEQRRAREQLLDLRARLFADVAHEFRTPLTLILGPLDDLLEGPAADRVVSAPRARLATMRRHARRLLRLIGQLLDFARIEAGALELERASYDPDRLFRGIAASFRALAEARGIDLRYTFDGEQAALLLDRDKAEKVATNLISNALKFCDEGETVRVTVRVRSSDNRSSDDAAEPGRLVLEVRDSGQGIPEADLPHIFERFRRAGSGDTVGTGIGLALTRELVRMHGGTIEATSEVGFGSTFTVTLPVDAAPEMPASASQGSAATTRGTTASAVSFDDAAFLDDLLADDALTGEATDDAAPTDDEATTVLLVEDHDDVRAYAREVLGDTYRFLEARDGAEGLALARQEVPDLVVSDVMMPGLDGFALCQALKTDPVLDHVPVILLTARASAESKVDGLERGADAYLTKPFNARELQAHVENLLQSRRLLRRRFSLGPAVDPTRAATGDAAPMPSAEEVFVEAARTAVEARLSDQAFDVGAFADALGMSRRQLQRKLRAITGETPNAFVRQVRLHHAVELLRHRRYETVAEVAYAVGFSSASYFSRCFRDAYGTAPTDFAEEA
ncbi:MAG: ATP-binding protein [Bacteroidota bacterium]